MTRLKNQFLGVVKNPFNLVVMISLIVLFCLIVIPLLQMIASTFTVAKGELRRIPGAKVGDFTLYYWKYLMAGQMSKATNVGAVAQFYKQRVHGVGSRDVAEGDAVYVAAVNALDGDGREVGVFYLNVVEDDVAESSKRCCSQFQGVA